MSAYCRIASAWLFLTTLENSSLRFVSQAKIEPFPPQSFCFHRYLTGLHFEEFLHCYLNILHLLFFSVLLYIHTSTRICTKVVLQLIDTDTLGTFCISASFPQPPCLQLHFRPPPLISTHCPFLLGFLTS